MQKNAGVVFVSGKLFPVSKNTAAKASFIMGASDTAEIPKASLLQEEAWGGAVSLPPSDEGGVERSETGGEKKWQNMITFFRYFITTPPSKLTLCHLP